VISIISSHESQHQPTGASMDVGRPLDGGECGSRGQGESVETGMAEMNHIMVRKRNPFRLAVMVLSMARQDFAEFRLNRL
jgi:hypothetical protein